ncbi:sensor histidine kinase [Paenibacillus eucommiae]|uniref:Two-component system sensor histidine kinase YesM n=1 Tax=Paenibacillus eucommiae TaxID=1355755 RepID=A0ABS4J3W6_9BACL|nr:histidine kinase [Paenibacillus eucommiae]MBP1994500.1 two-component system sensor histidine kinase YesM [Paenibacillus eucommiae]
MIKMSALFPFRYGIFLKLLTTFLLICIPVYLISSLMSKSGVELIRQQILVLMEQKSDFFVSSMDSELKRVFQLQEDFLKDPDLQVISIRSDTLRPYERTKTINDLHSKLFTLSVSSRYIKEAFIIMPNIQRRLSSLTGLTEMNSKELNDFLTKKPSASGLVAFDERIYFPMGFPYLTKSQFLLVIELSVDKISEELADPNAIGNGTSYIMGSENSTSFIISPNDATAENIQFIQQTASMQDTMFKKDNKNYLRFTKPFTFTDWSFVTVVEGDQMLQPVYSFKIWLSVLYAISIFVVLIVSLLLLRFIHKPLRKLMQAFKMVEIGQFDINLQHRNKDEFHYLYQQFNQMTGKLKILVQQVYEQTIRSQKAELKQLQSQVNPHFLYNSLYILYRMAQEEDFEGVSAMSKHLGDYFKFITQNKADFIPLDKELQHAKVYTSIQQIRFGSRIAFHFAEDGPLNAWEVPRLIIQPFLENAIVHGLEDTYSNGLVNVRVTAAAEHLTVEIEDNGKGASPEQLMKWEEQSTLEDEFGDHALWNVHRRLQLRYGSSSGVRLHTNHLGGLTATLIILIEGANEDE